MLFRRRQMQGDTGDGEGGALPREGTHPDSRLTSERRRLGVTAHPHELTHALEAVAENGDSTDAPGVEVPSPAHTVDFTRSSPFASHFTSGMDEQAGDDEFDRDEDLIDAAAASDGEVDGGTTSVTVPSPESERFARRRRKGRTRQAGGAMSRCEPHGTRNTSAKQRVMVLSIWRESGLPAKDFAAIANVSPQTLYHWRQRFQEHGPAGLENQPRGRPATESRLAEETRRAILLMKKENADWGIDRISATLRRWEGHSASPAAIQRVLEGAGYKVITEPTRPHRSEKPQRFERARPGELWQSDLFSFVLKRQGTRVHLVVFLDDHSRFIVGFSLHAIASGAMVRETFEAAGSRWGFPIECLTDRGPQFYTWRGTSTFTKLCQRRGVKHLVARAKRPQTVGKTERFWSTLWRELIEKAVFRDIDDARKRVGLYLDGYNFLRVHSSLGALVPADRFFQAAPEIKETLRRQIADNAFELARDGVARKPLYLSGRVGDLGVVSLHAEGDRVLLIGEDGRREEVDLAASGRLASPGEATTLPEPVTCNGIPGALADGPGVHGERAPGTSPLDSGLEALDRAFAGADGADDDPDFEVVDAHDAADSDSADGDDDMEASA